ncbi:MAG: hypothetical protein PHV53_02580 [Fermentimonas sp.]|nr:hypothetical protein [Fermentimonas sp.]
MDSVESLLKKPVNVLVCFTDAEIGRTLSNMAVYFANSRSEKSSATFLHLIDENEDENENQTQLNDFIDIIDKSKLTIRYFARKYDDYVSEILKVSKEQNSNLLLVGIGSNILTPEIYKRYSKLKSDPTNSEAYILEQFTDKESKLLSDISSLLDLNPISTGLFIYNNLKRIEKIFVPILSTNDIHAIPFTTIRFAQKENVELMVWDAIGAIESNPKMQKLYQSYVKKADERMYLWDDNKKIDKDFIMKQDLCIIGIDGWNKLICTSLPWIEALPSTLIVKEKTT